MIALFDVAARTLSLTQPEGVEGEFLTAMLNRYGQTVPMAGVRFGYALVRNGGEPDSEEWPPAGAAYESTDQDVLHTVRLDWKPGDEVEVAVWLVDSTGTRHEASATFISPIPESPFPSWIWSDGEWRPPVPYPEDYGQTMYDWDEEMQAWIAVEFEPP